MLNQVNKELFAKDLHKRAIDEIIIGPHPVTNAYSVNITNRPSGTIMCRLTMDKEAS
jgi:hypothetical protein